MTVNITKFPDGIVYRQPMPPMYRYGSIGYRPTNKFIIIDDESVLTEEFVKSFIDHAKENNTHYLNYRMRCICSDELCKSNHHQCTNYALGDGKGCEEKDTNDDCR